MSDNDESAARGAPTRCVLIPNPVRDASYSGFGSFANWRFVGKQPPQPSLAIDVGADAIWLIDLNTNKLIASAWLAQVSATPAQNIIHFRGTFRTPVLVVHVPGVQRLTIACGAYGPDAGRWTWTGTWKGRFSWRGDVPREKPPAYYVSLAEWLTLVEKFGLTPYLEDRGVPR